jgi:hypothetical protein
MSVTITIKDNQQYVDQNCPELIEVEDLFSDSDYPTIQYKFYPFEFNLANVNFADLWRNLGLYTENCYSGSIHASYLLAALKQFRVKSLCRGSEQETRFYAQGIDLDRATRYYWSLMHIAKEAEKRNTLVTWC